MSTHPDRAWRLNGATNFRDLGGYIGRGGRPVRWRRLFRSDHLGSLSEADKSALAELGLARTFDFRGVAERAAMPCELSGITQHSLAIEPTVVQSLQDIAASGRSLTVPVVVGVMQDLYRGFVNDHSHRFAELFEHLLQADAPVVFHCTAGKDRTGVAAALILSSLGVARDQVMQDYLLSNALYRRPPAPHTGLQPEVLAVLWRVQEGFLTAALQAVDDDQGGIDAYLERRLRLSGAARKALVSRYLVHG